MRISALLVSMPQEMLNDAKWHLLEAERFDKEEETAVFLRWREVRATAIFAMAAVESFMNTAAHYYVQEHPDLDEHLKDYLQERERRGEDGKVHKRRYLGIEEKLSEWTKIITGKTFDKSDQTWGDFEEVKDFRHYLIHYKRETTPSVYNRGTVDMARRSVRSAESVVERFYQCWGRTTPDWVHAAYREIRWRSLHLHRKRFDAPFHYQKIVVVSKDTMLLMEEIDDLIPSWPIE